MAKDLINKWLLWFKGLSKFKKIIVAGSASFISLILPFYLSILLGIFGAIPNKRDLTNLEALQASIVYGQNQEQLGKIFEVNRTYVAYDTLPKSLINALVATEDERFFEHAGVDNRALGRVIFKGILKGENAGGGSTISQQLIKNTFGRKQRRRFGLVIEKIKEMVAARRLERIYSKEKILELYFNTVPFGENVYGIEAAAERFYSKHPSQLKIEESAVLVGLLKANTSYNPRLHPEASEERRNVVFAQMLKNNFVTDEEFTRLNDLELKINYNYKSLSNHQPHYLSVIENEANTILAKKKKRNGKPYDIKNDGLKIYTSINAKMQYYAEEAVHAHMQVLQKQLERDWGRVRPWGAEPNLLKQAIENSRRYQFLQRKGKSSEEIQRIFKTPVSMNIYYADKSRIIKSSPLDSIKHLLFQLKAGFMVKDNASGGILAYVGSPSYQHFKYDYVTAKRQAASTFKPIVYATALEQGYKPCQYIRNDKITYTDYNGWEPENSNKKYGGKYSMAGALANSVNVVAVDLLYKSKRENVIELAYEMGIHSEIPALPSIALGVADINLKDMITAYSVFANGGLRKDPFMVLRIEDKSGKVLYQAKENKGEEVMDEENAQLMVKMLEGVVDKGTGRRIRSTYKLNNAIGGKTGTAQNYSDGWFIAVTPTLSTGAWVGGDQRAIRFRNGSLGQGSNMALPIVALLMQKMNADTNFNAYTQVEFEPLEDDVIEMLNCADYVDDNGLEKFFNNFRNTEMSDERIERRNRRKKILKSVFDILK
ncbi:MAG: transglycosylase domain-containing protein [Bacteroidia bacterium]